MKPLRPGEVVMECRDCGFLYRTDELKVEETYRHGGRLRVRDVTRTRESERISAMPDKDWIDVLAEDSGANPALIQALRDNLRQAEVYREQARTCDANASAITTMLRLQVEDKAHRRMLQSMAEGMAEGFKRGRGGDR